VQNYIYYKTGDAIAAESIVIEVFVKIWSLRGKAKGSIDPTLSYSLALLIIRKKRLPKPISFAFETSNEFAKNHNVLINNTLSRLPSLARTVFLMNRLDGLGIDEIGKRLKIKVREVIAANEQAIGLLENECRVEGNKTLKIDEFLNLFANLMLPVDIIDINVIWQQIRKEERVSRITTRLKRFGGLILILIMLVSMIWDWQLATITHQTPGGKFAYLLLPDSSFVTLNADSYAKYRKFGWKTSRTLSLSGEGLFEIAANENPFRIDAGKISITTHQAKINIYLRDQILDVKCLDGYILLKLKNGYEHSLTKGEGTVVGEHDTHLQVKRINIYNADKWTGGTFNFLETPLHLVFEELERQFNVSVEFQGFDPATLSFCGHFTNHDLHYALSSTCKPLELKYNYTPETRLVRVNKSSRMN
jgi:ferric-dicitrate binding protein FerR (iron transport regulator)/DNA-directed RNA polymerase specialized sigma24 family protein